MREPGSSSLSANSSPPPAPQQYGFSRLRTGSLHVGAEPRQQLPRLVDHALIPAQIARIVIGDRVRSARAPQIVARQLARRTPPSGRSPPRSRTSDSRRRSSSRSAGTRRRSSSARPPSASRCWPAPAPGTRTRCRSAWPASPVHVSFDSTPNCHLLRAQDLEQRAQRLLEVGLERAGATEPHQHVVLRRDRTSRAPRCRRTSGAGRSQPPDVRAPFEVVVDRAQIFRGRRRSTPAPRRAPIRIGRCSMPTGHWFSQAPQVVHCQSTSSE